MEKSKKQRILILSLFLFYSAITLICALRHEVWLDEAQAWVILRDAPLKELPYILNIEGHPPLWYAVLYPFVKLGMPPDYANLISWGLGVIGAWILLYKTELPIWLKIASLLSCGSLYLNSVMLRVYCLVPLILYALLWIYPNRRRHSILYGILVGMLADTHIMMCGMVGALGIFMIIDLFSEWKSSPKKENIHKLIGLAAAGTGVLILVVPLLGSPTASDSLNGFPKDIVEMYFRIFDTLSDTFNDAYLMEALPIWTDSILKVFLNLMFWCELIMLRHNHRAFVIQIIFFMGHYLINNLFWFVIPNRAAIFLTSLVFIAGISKHETPVYRNGNFINKTSGIIRKLLIALKKTDDISEKVIPGILTAYMICSVPSAAYYLIQDIGGSFCPSKDVVQYIEKELEYDAVLVSPWWGMPEISFYNPKVCIYSVYSDQFVSYCRWKDKPEGEYDFKKVSEKLKNYSHIYIVGYNYRDYCGQIQLFSKEGNMIFDTKNNIEIYKYNEEYIELICEQFNESEKEKD